MEQIIVKTVAAFLNSDGGTLLIGVADDGAPLGLAHDLQTLGDKNNLRALANALTCSLLYARISGRVICLEQSIARLVSYVGFNEVRRSDFTKFGTGSFTSRL